MLGCYGMACKILSNLHREASSSLFITPKHNDPCNEVQNKNHKQKKDQKASHLSSSKRRERERERERAARYHTTFRPSTWDPTEDISS
jgi:hypothetical protein